MQDNTILTLILLHRAVLVSSNRRNICIRKVVYFIVCILGEFQLINCILCKKNYSGTGLGEVWLN